jgi:FOG: FHA domain
VSVSVDPEEDEVAGLRPDGTPDPAYAAALGLVPASAALRSLAFAIDAVIVVVLVIPSVVGVMMVAGTVAGAGGFDLSGLLFPLILLAAGELLVTIYYVVQLLLHGLAGLTIGKALCGIRSVRVTDFARPGFWRMVLRAIVFGAAFTIVPVLGAVPFLLSPLWDPEKRGRGWLDRIGGNWLVNVRTGLNPFDAKALRLARKRVAMPTRESAAPLPSLATSAGMPTFVPGTRSSSGVIGAAGRAEGDGAPVDPWSPPPIGLAMPSAPPEPATPPPAEAQPAATPATATPTSATPTSATPMASATLLFDDGTSMVVDGDGLLGRNPQPRPGEDVRHLIPVRDESMQISKTHIEFGVDGSGLWVSDRSSANGTQIVTPAGERMDVPVGEHYPVAWGSVVEVGGRAFRVVRHAADADRARVGHIGGIE